MIGGLTQRVYRTNGVEIDRDTGLVRRVGFETHLRHKAHRMLLCLIENRAAPVTKEDLIRLVWDGAAISDDALVNCVQEIRKALGDDARNPIFVRTIPKTGYWFIAPLEEADPHPAQPPPVTPPSKRPIFIGASALTIVLIASTAWIATRSAPRRSSPEWAELLWLKLDEGTGSKIRDSISGRTSSLPPGIEWGSGPPGSRASLRFTGGDTPVTGDFPLPLSSGAPQYTSMAWIRSATHSGDASAIFQHGHPNPSEPFASLCLGLHQTGKAALFANRSTLLGTTLLEDDHWHHVAAVYEGATRSGRLYIDGVEQAHGLLETSFASTSPAPRWSIGRALWGGTPFRGSIGDVRVLERAVSPAEIQALFRCTTGPTDLHLAAKPAYFVPINGASVEITSAGIRNTGADYSGVAIAVRQPGCPIRSTVAADAGQDITIEAEIRTAGNSTNQITEAGPFFRSRPAAPGDGIIGGTSAGFWVQLLSTGQVRIRRLNPSSTIAFTAVPPIFDPNAFHKLSTHVKGDSLIVHLDGQPLAFDQAGRTVNAVQLAPAWESATPKGRNRGAAGIAFSAEANRHQAGGQQARNIRITP
ncbi:MAG: LamG-like jellyroll fold domain-containing protein [Bryobacteraceae bacterium]